MEIGGKVWAATMDEFSPEEDLFGDIEPAVLGHNLVTAVLSDLFACGARPEFFMHSMVLSQRTDNYFVDQLAKGMSSTLDKTGCYLLGGDVGRSDNWRYTGFAMGPIESGRNVSRVLPAERQSLWITGTIGDANLAALMRQSAPLFELRLAEARYISKNATGCIDTSGGLMDALWSLRTVNPMLRFEVDIAALPIDDAVIEFCATNDIPVEAFLFGGAGEYELLFSTMAETVPDIQVTKVATVFPSRMPGVFACVEGSQLEIKQPPPCPRNLENKEAIH